MTAILASWQIAAASSMRTAHVLPDGCRDVILALRPYGKALVQVTSLDRRAHDVSVAAGTEIFGLRLRPGAALNADARGELEAIAGAAPVPADEAIERILPQMRELVNETTITNDEVVAALAASRSVAEAARHLGVTARTLHRHAWAALGTAPSFWLDLSRSRRALAALGSGLGLAEIADLAGFADQAHFTRSFGALFGMPPGRFRRDRVLMRRAADPGFSG